MANQAKHFRFRDLLPELRENVYEKAFEDEVLIHDHETVKYLPPGILLVCKQIHLEAIKTFYKVTTFDFSRYKLGLAWYVGLRARSRDAITNMHFRPQTAIRSNGRQSNYPTPVDAGAFEFGCIKRFWDDVEKHGLPRRRGILAVNATVRRPDRLPLDGRQLWDGQLPTREMLPSRYGQRGTVWVTENLQQLDTAK